MPLSTHDANTRLAGALLDAMRAATREVEMISLTDAGDEDLYPHPYDVLRRILVDASKQVRELKRHTHEWNEDDYCAICGADGRA